MLPPTHTSVCEALLPNIVGFASQCTAQVGCTSYRYEMDLVAFCAVSESVDKRVGQSETGIL